MGETDSTKKGRWSMLLRLVVFLGIGVFFIYWFLLKLDGEEKAAIWESFKEAEYVWVAVAIVCSLLSHWVRAMRWRLLYKPIGDVPPQGHTFGAVMVAYLGNLALPRAGEVMRCAALRSSDGIPVDKSLGTVVTERVIDMVAFAVVIVIGLLAMFDQAKDWLYDTLSEKFESLPSMAIILAATAGVVVIGIVLYKVFWKRLLHFRLFRKIDSLMRGVADGVKSILHLGGRDTVMFIIYSLIIYLLYILGGLIIFQAFEGTRGLGFGAAFVVYLFGSVGMTFSQGGIGVYPVMVQLALGMYGVAKEEGTACGWMLWGSQQAIVLVVGAAFLIYFSIKKKKQ